MHFSGQWFILCQWQLETSSQSFASKTGSIEAICPVHRGYILFLISAKENWNSILSELRAAKSSNITIILDCCHAGNSPGGEVTLIFYHTKLVTDFFTTFASKAGSIEATCPVQRGYFPFPISAKENWTQSSLLRSAKSPNIAIILDWCHALHGRRCAWCGAFFQRGDTNFTRL